MAPLVSALALPIAYIYATGYEFGHGDRFGIPRGMVCVDLRSSLVPFLWLLFMVYCVTPFQYQIQARVADGALAHRLAVPVGMPRPWRPKALRSDGHVLRVRPRRR